MHTGSDIAKLKLRLTTETVNSDNSSLPHLLTTNAQVDLHNMTAFAKADEEKNVLFLP